MKIVIDAIDTLFFKDGKPFTMGEENWAEGIFPPNPSVFYGSLRTAYFAQNKVNISDFDTQNDPTKQLKIKSIYYLIDDQIYLPAPAELVKEAKKSDKWLYQLDLIENDLISNYSFSHRLVFNGNKNVENASNYLIDIETFYSYLNGEQKQISGLNLNKLVLSEPKVGIGRANATHSTAEGKLYRVGMRRLESELKGTKTSKIKFIIDFEGIELEANGFLKLGAEGKMVSYKNYSADILFNRFEAQNTKEGMFKLYLLTPAIFENGAIPDLTSNKILSKIKCELIAAAVAKPISIGGFDMKLKTPKIMRKAVPAGSVYYFKTEENLSRVYDMINNKSIAELETDSLGYGIAIMGAVK